ncbi:3-hydroxyisobutyryl-CoA hydrolase-like protein 1, mitochondrial [Prosopis cineraria]|uniref:3-hydroxyisobutyryl-CoA hydrolase-like protein 1, mitochondrial n=1 Tax=Prosopis cineraria TaxID=364024 RepID=UPI00240FC445|nr:3-hydroxyisobutyryl-CoA hydrolase-like protein 1, mitochondrial [Prosopis cineraria]
MASSKAVSLLRRSLHSSRILTCYRSHCSVPESSAIDNVDDEVLVEGKSASRTAILNRPSVLNAINSMTAARLHTLYKKWEDNPDIGFVMVKGRGRAFSAGGDIVAVYHLLNQGNLESCKEFFRTIYSFIYFLGTYLKPHVALLNGITMGGGAGISIPGTFRVGTDKTIFATPETLIGFHPDAGASFYLSHLPGHLGEYLGLTGEKLNGVEMINCGLATHYTLSARLPLLEEQLGKLVTDDPSVIETTLEKYGDLVRPDSRTALQRIEIIDKCFCHDTVEEIVDALTIEANQANDAWCIGTLNRLKEASPLSLKVALRSIREGRFQTLDQCLSREYHMSLQGISKQISGDFCEGVRARMVDKDMAPKWDPPTLDKVSDDMVDQYFLPVSVSEPGLDLPAQIREAFI